MKNRFIFTLLFSLVLLVNLADGYGSEDDHERGHDHEEAEVSDKVGADKGILEADEHIGFKLSPEAHRNFEIQTQRLGPGASWRIPVTAVLRSGEESNLYRFRDGFFKRIDFKSDLKPDRERKILVTSSDLRSEDEIVLMGLGFLRIAELAAFGGVADGHSH
ncbi:MAG: hypothetical protein KF789_06270 [Bdellovibrionaceae bacterium]|nr:hypothetical protein [Pseudobdellovibrionaceae bacterium]